MSTKDDGNSEHGVALGQDLSLADIILENLDRIPTTRSRGRPKNKLMEMVDVGRAIMVDEAMARHPEVYQSVATTAVALRDIAHDPRVQKLWKEAGNKPRFFDVIEELFPQKLDAQDFRESVSRGRKKLQKAK